MGVKIAVISLFAIVACVSALPARSSDAELIDPKYGDQPIVDTGVITGGGGGFFDSFEIFKNMDSVMRRMQEQMNSLLNRFGTANSTITDVGDFSGFGLPAIPDLDLGKGNTTSVTKVIDGHKVVINETKYSNENANGGAFFKVRVIEVKPETPDREPESSTKTSPRDVEPLENSQENEIPKQSGTEARYEDLEPLDDIDYTLPSKIAPHRKARRNLEDFDEENRIDGPYRPYDLSNDIKVNYLLAKNNYPINPDSEFIQPDVVGNTNNMRYDIWNKQIMGDYAHRPYDLSNDIKVNYLLAKKNYPINPDSEFIEPVVGNANDMSPVVLNNQIMGDHPYRPYDLSNDINVNYLLAKNNYPINPDSEFIQPIVGNANYMGPNYLPTKQIYPINPNSEFIQPGIWNNEITGDHPYRPYDLSNNIKVNYQLSTKNYPLNPNVENFQTKPKAFEKFINPR